MSEHPSSPVYQWINVPHLEAMLLQQGETDRKTSETGAESKKEPDRSQFSMMWDALKMGDWCENTRKAFSACVCVFSLSRHRLTHCWRKPTANGVHKKYWLIHTHTRFLSAPISAFKPLQNSRSQCCEADVRGRQWTRDQRRVQKGENGRQVYVTKLYPALTIIYIYLFILNYLFLLNTQTHKQEWCPYTDRGLQLLCLISLGLRIKSFLSFDFSEIRADINTGLSKPLRQGN